MNKKIIPFGEDGLSGKLRCVPICTISWIKVLDIIGDLTWQKQ